MDQADDAEFSTVASVGVWHCILHQLHSHWIPCFQSHSFLVYGETEIDIYFNHQP